MNEFAFHPEAEVDLIEIWDFIAEDSVDAADRVRDDIFAAIRRLVRTPNQRHRRDDLTSRPLRFWRVYDYLIAYAPEKPLLVLAVLHGRRNPRFLLVFCEDGSRRTHERATRDPKERTIRTISGAFCA